MMRDHEAAEGAEVFYRQEDIHGHRCPLTSPRRGR